ncbi:TPA: hypothetical protein N0F65_011353 [Lagenidium giganteum]|uniref:Leucine-rich repeat domain, L domain-like n=1 Tax=Lagenidium giganteum TaxID=4803 RepID=A0AAV2Z4J3_9STRA|nr:TPA: hypothetical protein N0F65_011353 [Lagenidium giganteum]
MKQAQHQWQHLFGPRGLLGVQGEYFDTVVFCREVLETALQTSQAYRLSRHVPRVWLNRAYDAILITNCWSTTVINVRWSHPRQVALRRLLCLISDLVLDLVSTLVVPLVIAATYAADYDYDNNGLFEVGMYDDRWMLHFLNECNLVVVSSWLDLFGRLLFSFSALVSLQSVKTLLQRRPTGTTRVQPVSGPLDTLTSNLPQRRRKHRRCGCSELELSRNVFCVWGLVVLVLQAHAETLSVVGVCLMQVRPWLNRKPACLLVDINCKRTTSVGAANDIDVILNSIDEQVVQHLLVRHCPDMHVPASVQSLHQLLGFKIYNSSLVEWSPEAALTDRTHPLMLFCFLIRAHFKDGVLPAGMIDRNFPHSLLDIEIVDSNLMDLPSDLHQRWPAGVNLYLEKCSLGAHLPHTLFHMHLSALSLSGSISFADAPVELLERLNGIMALMLQSPVLQRLPESVAVVPSSLRKLFLAHTNISYLPDWMDNRLLQTLRVDLWGTPICAALSRNETTGLANASLDIALAVKNKKLRCKPYNETMYPLWLDDMLLSE